MDGPDSRPGPSQARLTCGIWTMPTPNPLRAVTFDVGGTLIEPWPSVGEVYAAVAAPFGLAGVAPEALNRQFAQAWTAREHFDYSRHAWQELVRQTFAGLAPEPPNDACC